MPKILDYPRDSIARSLELAKAVDSLGGSSTPEICAEKMGRRFSGAFGTLLGAAGKYGFVETSKSRITTTDLYKTYKHAYTEEEKRRVLRKALENVPVFSQLIERFHEQKVPEDILAKILVREFGVRDRESSRVASFFIDGIRDAGIADSGGENSSFEAVGQSTSRSVASDDDIARQANDLHISKSSPSDSTSHTITINGPGFHSEIKIGDLDDILIVEAMLGRIKKQLKKASGE